ncbi:radical SAM protein [Fusobacterium perfoetens]|uniref:radical SAM protein n=1 Tax=Fusobacterium perfoetens TaxID=852 RepID=UPI0004861A6B|nr:radical SAM protein [Fusobacterium perfoetens]MCI6153351.1 radical SAM protein [Fusobacterium perfoetens]MDY3237142.1 radical SAM protein [Fusobacterium perfoetens]
METLKFVYGPIPSRRLGKSLGVSPIPQKTCNYSCIYCQLGRTNKMTNERQEFFKLEDIINEFKVYLKNSDVFDVVTVVGEGEPTLYSRLGELVRELKKLTDKPVAVITNGALLNDKKVQEDLMEADIVLPSINGYNEEISKKIDRPYGKIKFDETLKGIIEFSHLYEGELWLEIMLLDGINDSKESIAEYKKLLEKIKYTRVYLNTCVRPPAEPDVNMISKEKMQYAVEELGGISIDMLSSGSFFSEILDDYEAVLSLCKRHPMNQFELRSFLESRKVTEIDKMINKIEKDSKFNIINYKGIKTYRVK